jgi:hypothetical protein
MTILEQMLAGRAPAFVPLTVEQYHQMIAGGILREGEPIELIDGILIRKDRADRGGDPMSHGPRHASGVKRLQRIFRKVEEWGFHLQSQLPVTLGSTQEPEPDLAVVRGHEEDFLQQHPGPADISALMEVADSSLSYDRTTKQALYAGANIPLYWIINLADRQIEVYQDPQPFLGQYRQRTDYPAGQKVNLTLGPGWDIEVMVDEMVL